MERYLQRCEKDWHFFYMHMKHYIQCHKTNLPYQKAVEPTEGKLKELESLFFNVFGYRFCIHQKKYEAKNKWFSGLRKQQMVGTFNCCFYFTGINNIHPQKRVLYVLKFLWQYMRIGGTLPSIRRTNSFNLKTRR